MRYCAEIVIQNEFVLEKGASISISGSVKAISSDLFIELTYDTLCEQCGETYSIQSAGSWTINSPGYPSPYGAHCSCFWQGFVDDSSSIFKITFSKLQLGEIGLNNNSCGDYIKVYNGASITQSEVLGKFCSGALTEPLKTTSNIIAIQFESDSEIDSLNTGFSINIATVKKEDELAGLQSIAAILGAISFGIFIGLLLCSVLYKRWSRERSDTHDIENGDEPGEGGNDVIAQSAPPSYRKVMADPDQYPTPASSPVVIRGINGVNVQLRDMPATEPPEYPGTEDELHEENANALPVPPQYDIVSESEDEWFPVKRKKPQTSSSNLLGSDGMPPSYDAVTSEGSDRDALFNLNTHNRRHRLRSRTSRSSLSQMPQAQAQSNHLDSDTDDDEDKIRTIRANNLSKLPITEISDLDEEPNTTLHSDIISELLLEEREPIPLTLQENQNGYSSDRVERCDVFPSRPRSRSFNDLKRFAVHNSIERAGFLHDPRLIVASNEIIQMTECNAESNESSELPRIHISTSSSPQSDVNKPYSNQNVTL